MQVDVLLEPFGGTWPALRDAAAAVDANGLDGVWLNDHLAGSVHGAPHVLECWTILSSLAAAVPRISIGSLVLNVANRDPGTLAVMAATLQHVSGGRLLLGLGAGGGPGTPYATEQQALGRVVEGDRARRWRLEVAVATLRRVWTGAVPPARGFLRPEPAPPIVVAGFGPKMAELAGRVGDGICVPVGAQLGRLVEIARTARLERPDPAPFVVTASVGAMPASLDPLHAAGVDRLIVSLGRPDPASIERLAMRVGA